MKRNHLLKSLLLLCALIVGSVNVWAADVVYKEQQFKSGASGTFSASVNSYTESFDNTYNGFTCNYSNFNNNSKGWNYVKCGRKNNASTGTIITDAAIDKAINKVDLTIDAITAGNVTSIKLYTSSNKSSWTEAGTFTKSTGTQRVTLSSPAANLYYKIEAVCTSATSNGLVTISNIKFYIEQVDITAISIPTTETVGVGGTVTLTPTITPANATGTIDWESDNTSVATVDNGVVTGVAAGTAKITAKSHDDASIKAECTVTVTAPVAVTGVTLDKSSLALYFGNSETLVATIAPGDATNKGLTWESDNEDVATVDNGVVTAVGIGTCTITVTTDDGGYTATCDVSVSLQPINLTSPVTISDWTGINSGYYTTDTYLNIDGYTFKLLQCCKQVALQFKANAGVLTSPIVNCPNGFTVIVETADGSNATGVLTLQIGSESAVTVTGGNKTVSATTNATSAAFTIKNLNSGVMKVGKIIIIPNEYTTEVQSYGWATFIAPAPVEFAANTAYVVTDADVSTGITFEEITEAPAGTPLLLKGAGDKAITVVASATAPTKNLLTVSDGTFSSGEYPYVLAKDGTGACFKQWLGDPSVLNGRVVLVLDEQVAGGSPIFPLDNDNDKDQTTGISSIDNGQLTIDNAEVYNLSGQRVTYPSKGLYIVNGKKYVVK